MFGATFLEKAAESEAVEKDARLRRGKILPVIGAAPPPDGAEEPSDGPAVVPRRICCTQPLCAVSACRLLPSHPIDEKDDMPGFLAHQHVENLEQRLRQKAGPAGDLE